jgi:hypothetical protein
VRSFSSCNFEEKINGDKLQEGLWDYAAVLTKVCEQVWLVGSFLIHIERIIQNVFEN